MQTSPPDLPQAQPCARRGSVGRIVRKLLISVFAIAFVAYAGWRIANNRTLAGLAQAAHNKGEVFTLNELAAAYPRIPDASNAYVAFRNSWVESDPEFWDAFDAGRSDITLKPKDPSPRDLPTFGHTRKDLHPDAPLDPATLKSVDVFLQVKQSTLSAVIAAVQRPQFRAPIQFADGYQALLPYLSPMKDAAMLLQWQAVNEMENGNVDAAIDSIRSLAALGNLLREEPVLIGQLVRAAFCTMTINTAERLACRRQMDDRQLERLCKIIAGLDCEDGLKRALIGERAMMLEVFDNPRRLFLRAEQQRQDRDEVDPSPEQAAAKSATGMKIYGLIGMAAAEKRLVAETFGDAISCIETPGQAATRNYNLVFARAASGGRAFPPKLFSPIFLTSLARANDRFNRMEALRRSALAALAVERCRVSNSGIKPSSPNEIPVHLRLASTDDPFTGSALLIKQLPSGFLVYSTDRDCHDDDGLVDMPIKGPIPEDKDIGFRVNPPGSH